MCFIFLPLPYMAAAEVKTVPKSNRRQLVRVDQTDFIKVISRIHLMKLLPQAKRTLPVAQGAG